MGDANSIGGEEGSRIQPTEPSGFRDAPSHSSNKGSVEKAMHTPVKTLGNLKSALTKNLGEDAGKKLYNGFVQAFAMQMIHQVQRSAAQAKKAAQQMRQGPQG